MKTFNNFLLCTIIVSVIKNTRADIAPSENLKLKNDAILENDVPCVCPADPHLFTEAPVLGIMKRRFINNVLNNSVVKFEGDQVPMRDIVLKMIHSEVPLWHHVAFVNNIWLAIYLQSIEQCPSLGGFAQIVNASVAWDTSKDEKAISDALDEMADLLHNYVKVAGDGSIKAAGCIVETPTKFREHPSDGNELAYSIDKAWELGGDMVPSAYERAAKALYGSHSYKDSLMALMATISITKISQDFAMDFDNRLVAEFLHRGNITPIPGCCCQSFIEKINHSSAKFGEEALKVSRGLKKELSIA